MPLIVLGDMGLTKPLSSVLPEAFWIHGNHDCDDEAQYDATLGDPLSYAWCLHGRVTTIGRWRVAGLGGNFQARIWHPGNDAGTPIWHTRKDYLRTVRPQDRWRAKDRLDAWRKEWGTGLPMKARGAIWPEDVDRLAAQRTDVLVTHEAPTTHDYGFGEIDWLAEVMGVRLVVHGHHHKDYEARLPSGITVIGVGLGKVRVVELE